jgi:hypothetical protein
MTIVIRTEKDEYKVDVTLQHTDIRHYTYRVSVLWGDTAFRQSGSFNVVDWAQGQCGLVNIFNHVNMGRVDDDELYSRLIPHILDTVHSYANQAGCVTFCAYADADDIKSNRGLSAWLIRQENCKPVHHYRNQAHSPFTHMAMYVWHINPKGLPDEWGTIIKPIAK